MFDFVWSLVGLLLTCDGTVDGVLRRAPGACSPCGPLSFLQMLEPTEQFDMYFCKRVGKLGMIRFLWRLVAGRFGMVGDTQAFLWRLWLGVYFEGIHCMIKIPEAVKAQKNFFFVAIPSISGLVTMSLLWLPSGGLIDKSPETVSGHSQVITCSKSLLRLFPISNNFTSAKSLTQGQMFS